MSPWPKGKSNAGATLRPRLCGGAWTRITTRSWTSYPEGWKAISYQMGTFLAFGKETIIILE